jgi:hypothetical protein
MAEHDHITPCPVAALAAETAALLRAAGVWKGDYWKCNSQPADEGGISTEYLRSITGQRRDAIAAYAPHLTATSPKGALFQIYLAASRLDYLVEAGAADRKPRDAARAKDEQTTIFRGLRNAARFLEAEHDDDDLRTIREWYFDAELTVDSIIAEGMAA